MKLAAIDIGSNAVRLLLCRAMSERPPLFKKEAFFRMPLRLGEDAFVHKKISREKSKALADTLAGFSHLIRAYGAADYLACATSALRDAHNGRALVARINRDTGLKVRIVDGREEAQIIYANQVAERLNGRKAYLYMDVGGGSTQLTLFDRGKALASRSFRIGAVRLLKHAVAKSEWEAMKRWVCDVSKLACGLIGIGIGGNITKIFSLSGKKKEKPLSYEKLKSLRHTLQSYSLRERIHRFDLRPDRADVIVPASDIYLSIMKWGGIEKMIVPQVGLSDGLVHLLYQRRRRGSSSIRHRDGPKPLSPQTF